MNLNLCCSMIKLHWETVAWSAQPLTNFFPKTKHLIYQNEGNVVIKPYIPDFILSV